MDIRSSSVNKMILVSAVLLTFFYNTTFFRQLLAVYPLSVGNLGFLISIGVLLCCLFVVLLALVCYRMTLKPVLIILFPASSLAAYFMDSYQVIIDPEMLQNIVMTDANEVQDLLSGKLALYLLLLGVLPAVIVARTSVQNLSVKSSLVARSKILLPAVALCAGVIVAFGSHYASFIREHKPLRYYTNPTGYIYAVGKYLGGLMESEQGPVKSIAEDAAIPATDLERELIIFVLGETARHDHFSLNGYARETNPMLKRQNVISFENFWSCGTSTAVSVPCMFSIYRQDDYSDAKAQSVENLLDILQRSGVNVLWRDNNSSSKGVALRVPYQSYKSPKVNPVCDVECRDEGMLEGLQEFIDTHPSGDIFIVLHQMGNHGPAYYKRYPAGFEKFTPVCKTNQLEMCTQQEINNAYDNAILYTDHFLSMVIDLLKSNDKAFETVLFYISDHGESLGEGGLYLHGLPYSLSPEAQRHVPAIMWFGVNNDDVDTEVLRSMSENRYSHDNLFHSILSLLEIESSVYRKELDFLLSSKKSEH